MPTGTGTHQTTQPQPQPLPCLTTDALQNIGRCDQTSLPLFPCFSNRLWILRRHSRINSKAGGCWMLPTLTGLKHPRSRPLHPVANLHQCSPPQDRAHVSRSDPSVKMRTKANLSVLYLNENISTAWRFENRSCFPSTKSHVSQPQTGPPPRGRRFENMTFFGPPRTIIVDSNATRKFHRAPMRIAAALPTSWETIPGARTCSW